MEQKAVDNGYVADVNTGKVKQNHWYDSIKLDSIINITISNIIKTSLFA
jgi:hypothetical protein